MANKNKGWIRYIRLGAAGLFLILSGLAFSGLAGALAPFLRRFRERHGDAKTLWIYTGCVYELDLLPPSGDALGVEVNSPHKRWRTEATDEILSLADVLVDGPYVEALKDVSLRFRGSSNQRIIDLKKGTILT